MLIALTPATTAGGVRWGALLAGMVEGDLPPEGKNDSGWSDPLAPPLSRRAECDLVSDCIPKPLGAGDMPVLGEAPNAPIVRIRNGPGNGKFGKL